MFRNRVKSSILLLLVSLLTPIFAFAQTQNDRKANNKTTVARFGSLLDHPKHVELWKTALEQAYPVHLTKDYNIFVALTITESLYKSDEFQVSVSSKLLARTPYISKQILDEWGEALEKTSGEQFGAKLFTFLLILEQDRLFDGGKYNPEGLKNQKTRLASIPRKAVLQWSRATNPFFDSQAALFIVNNDAFFADNVFQEEIFTKRLSEIQAAKPK